MIILDTNVISEPARPLPSEAVLGWLNAQDRPMVYITAISEAEILAGIAAMPGGRRRDLTSDQMQRMFSEEFAGRILPFDSAAAREFHMVARRKAGKFVIEPDAQIAAIARSHRAALATRNTKDFKDSGIELINPWNYRT